MFDPKAEPKSDISSSEEVDFLNLLNIFARLNMSRNYKNEQVSTETWLKSKRLDH